MANSQRHRFQVERQKDGWGGEKGCGAMADQFKGSPIVRTSRSPTVGSSRTSFRCTKVLPTCWTSIVEAVTFR